MPWSLNDRDPGIENNYVEESLEDVIKETTQDDVQEMTEN